MNDKNTILRNIPQVEKLLQSDEIRRFIPEIGRPAVVEEIRAVLGGVRAKAECDEPVDLEGIIPAVASACGRKRLRKLRRVVNGTGVIIHTNLGRAPLGREIFERLADEISGYCSLEYNLVTGKRGGRGGFAEELLCVLAGSEDALIVNNNASSVFLILSEFARGKEVVVSRGELVQIGGGFRLPDIMRESGALLVEIGTTNITTIDDYRAAITANTAMLFSCHQSNFKMQGFTESPPLRELSALKSERIVFVRDLGSGNLNEDPKTLRPFEPTVRAELGQGPDLVCFSGDKLLGACQAGIIVGSKDFVGRLRRNPMMRMLRVDKVTYFILQEALIRHVNGEYDDIVLWNVMTQAKKDISARISRFMRAVRNPGKKQVITKIKTQSTIGGGAMPGFQMESAGVRIDIPGVSAEEVHFSMMSAGVPVVGTIIDGHYTLDFRTVLDDEVTAAAPAGGARAATPDGPLEVAARAVVCNVPMQRIYPLVPREYWPLEFAERISRMWPPAGILGWVCTKPPMDPTFAGIYVVPVLPGCSFSHMTMLSQASSHRASTRIAATF
jgi:L-seryl-tRNA(Ser) seleniumtransferase